MTKFRILLLLIICSSLYSCFTKARPLEKKAYPKLEYSLRSITQSVEICKLQNIPSNRSIEEVVLLEQEKSMFKAPEMDTSTFLSKEEKMEVSKQLKSFLKHELDYLNEHDYGSDYCADKKLIRQRWSEKLAGFKIDEVVKIGWSKNEKKVQVAPGYYKITKSTVPYELEVYAFGDLDSYYLKIDGKAMLTYCDMNSFGIKQDWDKVARINKILSAHIDDCN